MYADIAQNWLTKHRLGSNLWQGMLPGVDQFAAWNPPGYFYLTTATVAILGPSHSSQRLLSSFIGFIFILISFQIIRNVAPKIKPLYLWLLGFLFLTDYQFMMATRLARPEIVTILFGAIVVCLITFWKKNASPVGWIKSACLGCISTAAFWFHPLGLTIAGIGYSLWLIEKTHRQATTINGVAFTGGAIVPPAIWLLAYRSRVTVILTQMSLAVARKQLDTPWIVDAFKNGGLNALVYTAFAVMIGWLIWSALKTKHIISQWLVILAVSCSVIVCLGHMYWYIAIAIPFIYLAVICQLQQKPAQKNLIPIISILLGLNSYLTWSSSFKTPIPVTAYREYCTQILQAIPDHTTVFLSAIPDPYYCFQNQRRTNILLEFPSLPLEKSTYISTLNRADYIVFQRSYDEALFGEFLPEYLNQNTAAATLAFDPSKTYAAYIIQLVPQKQRIVPAI